MGDFNETVVEPNSGIDQMMMTCGLVDAFGLRLGNIAIPQTYKRSKRRIDFVAMTPELYESVSKIGYEPFDYRGIHSDHRGMYVDLITETVFGSAQTVIESARYRDFTADRPEVVVKYIARKHRELINHNIVSRLDHLEQLTAPDHALAERMDRDMVRASLIAAKEVKTKYRTPWSPRLATAWAEVHLLKMIKSQLSNSSLHNWSAILAWKDKHPGMEAKIPSTVPEAEGLLKEAIGKLKRIRQEAEELRQKHLEDRLLLYAALEQKNKEHIVRRIKRAEQLHQCYKKLQYICKDGGSNPGY